MKPRDLTIGFIGIFVTFTQFYVIFSLPPIDDKVFSNASANATVNSSFLNSTLDNLKSATNSTKLNTTLIAANSTDLNKKSNKTEGKDNGKVVTVYDLFGAPIPSAVIIAPANLDQYVVSTGEGGSNFATFRPNNAPAPSVKLSDGWFNWPFSWPDIFSFW